MRCFWGKKILYIFQIQIKMGAQHSKLGLESKSQQKKKDAAPSNSDSSATVVPSTPSRKAETRLNNYKVTKKLGGYQQIVPF